MCSHRLLFLSISMRLKLIKILKQSDHSYKEDITKENTILVKELDEIKEILNILIYNKKIDFLELGSLIDEMYRVFGNRVPEIPACIVLLQKPGNRSIHSILGHGKCILCFLFVWCLFK